MLTTDCDPTDCYLSSHRCCDCGQHTLPEYNDRNELIDHDCPCPSSNY